jgi:DNA end-binding protein Ku
MPRAIWTGSISFGLVNVPIRVVTAVSQKTVRFNQLHGKDKARIQQKRICPKEGKEVPYDEIVKGYEIAPDEYVIIEPEELEALDPEATHAIDVEEFVDLAEIDPVYFDRSYYLIPDKRAGKTYDLFLDALKRTKKVALGRVVMRSKEYMVGIRVREDILVMETMNFHDEVQPVGSVLEEVDRSPKKIEKKERDMAVQLIEALSVPFDPERHEDTYRERVLQLIEKKAEGETVVVTPTEKPKMREKDLMKALEESLKHAKSGAKANLEA